MPEWRPPTEDAVARELAEAQAGRLRWCHDARAWFVFDGALWRRDRTGAATRMVRDIAAELGHEPGGGRVAVSGRPGFVAGALRLARDELALAATAEDWDADPWVLGTPEGPVDLRSGASAVADPADGISRATAVAPAPPGAAAPAWLTFLDETFRGDAALIGFVQRLLGYALAGSAAERVAVLGCGEGAGKTVLLATVLHVMGDYAQAAEPAALARAGAGALAALRGTRLVALAEGEADWRKLARLVGGDPLGASLDGRRGTAPTFKLLAMARTPPRLASADAAVRGRLCVLPFRHRLARPDRGLAERLRAEAPEILRWMIDGCLDWQLRGLDPPPAVAEATAALAAPDTLDAFLATRCERGARTATAADLWRAWCAFAEARREVAGSQRLFAEALAARGFARERTESARFYRGIGLREADA